MQKTIDNLTYQRDLYSDMLQLLERDLLKHYLKKSNSKIDLEKFQKRRTKIISKMLDNPDKHGIYPSSQAYKELDKLFLDIVNQVNQVNQDDSSRNKK